MMFFEVCVNDDFLVFFMFCVRGGGKKKLDVLLRCSSFFKEFLYRKEKFLWGFFVFGKGIREENFF